MNEDMADVFDSEEFSAAPAEELGDLSSMIKKAVEHERYLAQLEEAMKAANAELQTLITRHIPDAMAAAMVSEFTTDDGWKVSIKDFVRGSLPKDGHRRNLAIEWLEAHEGGDLIKNHINIVMNKGQHEFADEVEQKLHELGVDYERKQDVHAQTLMAFARERLRNGEEVPLETLGLFAGRNAEIKPPKEAKPRAPRKTRKE